MPDFNRWVEYAAALLIWVPLESESYFDPENASKRTRAAEALVRVDAAEAALSDAERQQWARERV